MTRWVVKDKKTGEIAFETDKESVVNALNKKNYVAEEKGAQKDLVEREEKGKGKRVTLEDSPAAQ